MRLLDEGMKETPWCISIDAAQKKYSKLAHDPALAFPAGFDEARKRRLLRYMRHPRAALLLLHHR